jgi:hypothetical protein
MERKSKANCCDNALRANDYAVLVRDKKDKVSKIVYFYYDLKPCFSFIILDAEYRSKV